MAEEISDQQSPQRARARRANLLGAITALCLFLLGLAIVQPASARAATRAITVSPDTGLTAGQNVTVGWSGFSPGTVTQTILIEQCKQQITDIFADCAIVTLIGPSNGADGSGSEQYKVMSTNPNGTPFDEGFTCDATHPCAITVRETFDNSDNSMVSHNITFAASGGGTTTTTQPGATTTRAGETTTTSGGTTTTTQPGATTTTGAGETTTTGTGGTTTTEPGGTTTSGGTTTTGGATTTISGSGTTTSGPITTLGSGGGSGGGNLPFTGAAAHLPLVALLGIVSTVVGAGVRWLALSPRFGGPAS